MDRLAQPTIVQSYLPGEWGGGAWFAASAALVLLAGFVVLTYQQTYPANDPRPDATFLWFVALVLVPACIVIAGLIIATPPGMLTVIYERRLPASEPAAAAAPGGGMSGARASNRAQAPVSEPEESVEIRLTRLESLLAAGLITSDEHAAKRLEILARL